ncbi:hypothetical protein STRIP9103_07706, partial [Streptomyces ipomoeae 91-03]
MRQGLRKTFTRAVLRASFRSRV